MIRRTYPESICLRVTRRCNAACSFCQAPNTSRPELTLDQIRTVSSLFHANGARSAKLSGGEPTVRTDLPEIISTIHDAGLRTVITTNGIKVPNRVFDAAARYDAEFKFSIHRPDSRNDHVLRVRSFDRIRGNLATCRQRGIPFAVNTVVTTATVALMAEMVDFAIEHGARKISFIPVLPRGRASGGRDDIDPHSLATMRQRVTMLEESYRKRIAVHCIDIRRRDYFVVENDGSLWIERTSEDQDTKICEYADLAENSACLTGHFCTNGRVPA